MVKTSVELAILSEHLVEPFNLVDRILDTAGHDSGDGRKDHERQGDSHLTNLHNQGRQTDEWLSCYPRGKP
jgi:hypothetical protein